MALFERHVLDAYIDVESDPGAVGISERIDAGHATLVEADGSAPEIR